MIIFKIGCVNDKRLAKKYPIAFSITRPYTSNDLKKVVVSSFVSSNRESCGLYYKSFRIVIYDRNDSTIVEPVL